LYQASQPNIPSSPANSHSQDFLIFAIDHQLDLGRRQYPPYQSPTQPNGADLHAHLHTLRCFKTSNLQLLDLQYFFPSSFDPFTNEAEMLFMG
jgi:hypothetical protein